MTLVVCSLSLHGSHCQPSPASEDGLPTYAAFWAPVVGAEPEAFDYWGYTSFK